MKGIIGKKLGMTAVYNESGHRIACTVIEAGPCVVSQIRTKEKDGYEALQLSFQEKKAKNTTKPLQGHFKKAGATPKKKIVEFLNFIQNKKGDKIKFGDVINPEDVFEKGDKVNVIAHAKGKGTQGPVKRWGFRGVGDRTHGQHNRERAPGSIGAGSTPSRVFKGMRMAGRMGGHRVKTKNLKIIKIIDNNIMLISGSVSGARNGYIIIEK